MMSEAATLQLERNGVGPLQRAPTEESVSGSSSPEPPETFNPRYSVALGERVLRNGASVTFTLVVRQDGVTVGVVEREHADFVYLQHCVSTSQPSAGVILPPLPPAPHTDPASSKKDKGSTQEGWQLQRSRLLLQTYLARVLSHPVLGRSPALTPFLTRPEAPPRAKVKRGLLSRLHSSLSRGQPVPDCEEFFQKERAWLTRSSQLVEDFAAALQTVLDETIKVGAAQEAVCTALRLAAPPSSAALPTAHTAPPTAAALTSPVAIFCQALEAVRAATSTAAATLDGSVAGPAEAWSSYLASERRMLDGRTGLLLEYQRCNRVLERAVGERRLQAQEAQKEAAAAFEACSDTARGEIKRLHRARPPATLSLLHTFAQTQRDTAQRSLCALQAALQRCEAA